jgi:uncharacterized protein
VKKDLGLYETRVIGVLIEKAITTPDQYPLSLNAVVNGCNQKSNRHPVLELSHDSVADILAKLKVRGLVREDGYKSRVEKYSHRFCNTEFGELKFSPDEVAVICELMLRGPQTPGELRSHGHRMHPFSKVDEVEETLNSLQKHEKGPFVTMLPREPGKRESRFAHMLNSDVEPVEAEALAGENVSATVAELTELKAKVGRLEAENLQLKQRLRQLGEVC